MNRSDLIHQLQEELNNPQKSERWAMYRLIVPVIDFANSTLGLTAYFEFNQTSKHDTSQSVDIALLKDLKNQDPQVMVEAKRVGRSIDSDQISKYLLKPGVRGLVTNGVGWVLCRDGKSKAISIWHPTDSSVDAEALDEIVAFIRGDIMTESDWSDGPTKMDPTVKPEKLRKISKARRVDNAVQAVADVAAMRAILAKLAKASALDKLFLESMVQQFETQQGMPLHLRCEARSSRVVFFDKRIASRNKQRVARIELGRHQPDILVLTALVGPHSELAEIAPPERHDKGQHMRRFRLSAADQTRQFGEKLAEALSA